MFHNVSHQVSLKKANELLEESGYSPATALHHTAFSAFFSRRNLVAEYNDKENRTFAYLAPVILAALSHTGTAPETLILTDSVKELDHIKKDFDLLRKTAGSIKNPVLLRDDENIMNEIHLLAKKPAIIIGTTSRIIDHLRRNNIELRHIKFLVLDITRRQNRSFFDKDVLFISTKLSRKVRVFIFLHDYHSLNSLADIIKRPVVSLKNMRNESSHLPDKHNPQERNMSRLNEESIKKKINEFISTIKENEDPLLLKDYSKLIKKNVPFHLRRYFSAFLLKSLLKEGPVVSRGAVSSENNMQTLFVSIGKNRRVYPGDLSRFFQKSLDLDPEKIGPIKVLANYSFVELEKAAAEDAVSMLDGTTYRGKNITVNFARKKGEKQNSLS